MPLPITISKRNLKNVSVPYRVLSVAAGTFFYANLSYWRFNVHYIAPGGNYFNVNAGIISTQNVVLAAKFDQDLSDEIAKCTHRQVRVLPLKSRKVK